MITAQMATVPNRIELLPKVIDSLCHQVDRLNVMLNGHSNELLYKFFNTYLWNNVHFTRRQNLMTDGEKFYDIENVRPGYVFTCDDDILYPADYVQKSIEKIEQYQRRYVIGYHGRVWLQLPIKSYYTSRKEMYRCIEGFEGDHVVDCLGDGVSCWHTDTFKMRYDFCELPNMSQLWLGLKCNQDDVKQVAVGHPLGWLQDLEQGMYGETIWDLENENCGRQTELVNTRWKQRDEDWYKL